MQMGRCGRILNTAKIARNSLSYRKEESFWGEREKCGVLGRVWRESQWFLVTFFAIENGIEMCPTSF
jgi:hypothetical protein